MKTKRLKSKSKVSDKFFVKGALYSRKSNSKALFQCGKELYHEWIEMYPINKEALAYWRVRPNKKIPIVFTKETDLFIKL